MFFYILLDSDIHLRKFKRLRSEVCTAMSSLQRAANEYHLPLMKLFTVNNNYLPLIKIFTVNRIIYR